jgi:hypothetical protein
LPDLSENYFLEDWFCRLVGKSFSIGKSKSAIKFVITVFMRSLLAI